jgi:hypothetical protein
MPLLGFRGRRLVGAAVVGGAAYHMGKSAAQNQAHEQAQDAQIQQMQAQPSYAAPAPAAAPGTDVTAELQKLAQLHQSGVLTDAEFASAKQKLLGV